LPEARELAELAVELAADRSGAWTRLMMVCEAQGDQVCVDRAKAALIR
jgi:hypothetical protein